MTVFKRFEAYSFLVWEKLNTGHWSKVSDSWRELFTLLTLGKGASVVKEAEISLGPVEVGPLCRDLIKMCDVGLMMR